ncbi:MAG: hypothetical protein ACRDSH_01330 [Pseudonocardiaceae bacterium]
MISLSFLCGESLGGVEVRAAKALVGEALLMELWAPALRPWARCWGSRAADWVVCHRLCISATALGL